MDYYYFGFSWKSLIVFLLPMIPNIFYFFIPTSDASKNGNNHLFLDILEHGSQAIFIFLLIFVISKQGSELISLYTIGMSIMLVIYYVLWISYFTGNISLASLLGMAVLPVIYFVLAEIWLHNYLAIVPTLLFGLVHIIITCMDYQFKS